MKLNLLFILIDLLVILSMPFVFIWSKLARFSKAVLLPYASRK